VRHASSDLSIVRIRVLLEQGRRCHDLTCSCALFSTSCEYRAASRVRLFVRRESGESLAKAHCSRGKMRHLTSSLRLKAESRHSLTCSSGWFWFSLRMRTRGSVRRKTLAEVE